MDCRCFSSKVVDMSNLKLFIRVFVCVSYIVEEDRTKIQTHLLVGSTNLGNSACPAKIFS